MKSFRRDSLISHDVYYTNTEFKNYAEYLYNQILSCISCLS